MSSYRGRYDRSSRYCSAASSAETSPSTLPSSPSDPARLDFKPGLFGLLSHFGADFVRHRLGYLFIMVEMHRVLRPALTHRPQGIDVSEHVGERDHRIDDPRVAARVHPGDLAATAVQIADHVTHILLRRHHFDPHDRFEQFRRGLHDAFLERGAGRDLPSGPTPTASAREHSG